MSRGDAISRSAALEAIEEYIEEYSEIDENGLHNLKWCAMEEAKDVLLNLPACVGWNSVKDRLPDERQWVLCQCRAKIREVLRLQDGAWYHDPEHIYFLSFVTHWMPLPEPPKVE